MRLALADVGTGKVLTEQSIQEVRDSREPRYGSGAEWTRTVYSIPKVIAGEPMTVAAKVDVLKFADNSMGDPRRYGNLISLSASVTVWISSGK